MLGAALAACAPKPPAAPKAKDPLFETISALDTAVFEAFNTCGDPAQLAKHASYFAPNVEFYHDTGGVTWTRDTMIANTEHNVCGKIRRELIAGSLKVFPIKDFGALEQGAHRFCPLGSSDCPGIAEFVIIWHHDGDTWRITRVLSYAHRPNS